MTEEYEKYLGIEFSGKSGKKYTIVDFINKGGNGFVYDCKDETNTIYVVKLLHDFGKEKIKLLNFKNEIALQETLESPYIVKCIDSGNLKTKNQKNYRPFYVMKKYSKSLDQMINDGNITPISAYKYSLQLCYAIKTMHKREVPLIHRDLKPENILYDDKLDSVLLCDFGLTHIDNGNKSINDGFVGNVDYHAPEQKKRGKKDVGTYTDLFSLGLIINALFTKEIAIGENYKKIWECAPYFQFIDGIIEKMIQHDILKRENDINSIILQMEDYEMNYDAEESSLKSKCSKIGIPTEKAKEVMNLFSLSTFFLNNNCDWKSVNLNYCCDYLFNCSDIMKNSLLLCILYHKIVNVFEAEASTFYNLRFSNRTLNIENPNDKESIKLFLNNINVKVYDELSALPNIIGKYFLSIYDYHAREIIQSIDKIKERIDLYCIDAPILTLTYFVKKELNISVKNISSSNFIELVKYEESNVKDKYILFNDIEKPFKDFVSKIKKEILNTSYILKDNKLKIFFERENDELKFEELIKDVMKKLPPNDVRKSDLNDIINNYNSHLLAKIYIFDSNDVITMNYYLDIKS